MIELANDPKASRIGERTLVSSEMRKTPSVLKRGRTGPTWPFPSRYSERPAQQDMRKSAANDSGS